MENKDTTNQTKSKQKGKIGFVRYEILLMISIIICLSYMTMYESIVHRYSAISASPSGNLVIIHNSDDAEAYAELGWPIIPYNHDSTQFVTLYNTDKEEVYQLMLGDVTSFHEKIDSLKNWWPIFTSQEYGVIDLQSYGINMLINYRWLQYENGNTYLLVYNTDLKLDTMLNTFNIVQYIVIVLAFVMLFSIIYWRWYSIINKYKTINAQVQDIISSKH